MLKTRFLAVCSQNIWRVCSSMGLLRRGLRPLHSSQVRRYCGSANHRDNNRLPVVDESLPSQSRKDYFILPTAILAIAGAGIFLHYNDERRAVLKGSNLGAGSERNTINGPVIGGPFRLFDVQNHLVTESDLRGNWILMYFGYSSSPDVGPEEVLKMAKVVDNLESGHNLKITPLFITIDPQRDSPSQLRAYLKEFDPRILGLTGPIAAIRQIAQEYRIYLKKVDEEGQDYLVESSHSMYLLDPNMKIVKCFGVEYDAVQLSDAILEEVKKASK